MDLPPVLGQVDGADGDPMAVEGVLEVKVGLDRRVEKHPFAMFVLGASLGQVADVGEDLLEVGGVDRFPVAIPDQGLPVELGNAKP